MVGQEKEQMSDMVFSRMIGEHKAWLPNSNNKGQAKAKKAVGYKKEN